MDHVDYYKILEIDKNADSVKIKDAFRKRAFQFHPDRNTGNPEAAEKMKQVNEAYAVLSDETKKAEYDAMSQRYGSTAHNKFRSNYSEHDIFSGSDINRIIEELAKDFGLRGFNDIFKEVYGQGYQTVKHKKPGFFARAFVFPSPAHTSGPRPSESSFMGSVVNKITGFGSPQKGNDLQDKIMLTADQAKNGGPYAYYLKKNNTKLLVKVPPGVKDGQKIRLTGMGKAGKGGGPSGNLYLRVIVHKSLLQKIQGLASGIKKSIS